MDTTVAPWVRRLASFWRRLVGPIQPVAAPAGAHVLPAYAALGRYHLNTSEIDPRLHLLATQLAAERSGCQWCIAKGRHVWREAHLPLDLLRALPEFETSPLFSTRDRATLSFADALTRYSDADADDRLRAPLAAVRQHLSESEVAAITAAVAEMHFFNPVTGGLGADAVDPDRAPRRRASSAAWGAPVGSSLRSFWL